MSEVDSRDRDRRQRWARPNSGHDRAVRLRRLALPVGIGLLGAVLALSPLLKRDESSFVLNKDKVDRAQERLRVEQATYRGEDDRGRAFSLTAGSALQRSSKTPVVEMGNLSATMDLERGRTTIAAPAAKYDTQAERLQVPGPITVEAANGYRLDTANVTADLNSRQLSSAGRVEGRLPIGSFSAGSMRADLGTQTVTLEGRARLRIDQGAGKAR